MKKKIKKRYLTANAIRDEIEHCKAKALRMTQQAEAMEIQAKEFAQHPEMAEDATFRREGAKKLRKSVQRIYENRLPKLKQKLSDFMTELLPGIIPDGDRSVDA